MMFHETNIYLFYRHYFFFAFLLGKNPDYFFHSQQWLLYLILTNIDIFIDFMH